MHKTITILIERMQHKQHGHSDQFKLEQKYEEYFINTLI